MTAPKELVYVQQLAELIENIADSERERNELAHRHDRNVLKGFRKAAKLIWGKEKEQELYERATSPDDSTM